jgi:hypothetical protein
MSIKRRMFAIIDEHYNEVTTIYKYYKIFSLTQLDLGDNMFRHIIKPSWGHVLT